MATTGTRKGTTTRTTRGAANTEQDSLVAQARSAAIASAGIHTGQDFAALMSALMSDVIEERISPNVANAAINAGGKLLKVVEMQYRYQRPRNTDASQPKPAFELGGAS